MQATVNGAHGGALEGAGSDDVARDALHVYLAAILREDASTHHEAMQFMQQHVPVPNLSTAAVSAGKSLRFVAACRSGGALHTDDVRSFLTNAKSRLHIAELDSEEDVHCHVTQGLVQACIHRNPDAVRCTLEHAALPNNEAHNALVLQLAAAGQCRDCVLHVADARKVQHAQDQWSVAAVALSVRMAHVGASASRCKRRFKRR